MMTINFIQCFVSLKVKMHYDQTLKEKFGSEAINVLRRVMAQTFNIYYWPTLPTTVTFNVVDVMEIPDYIHVDMPSMYVCTIEILVLGRTSIIAQVLFGEKHLVNSWLISTLKGLFTT
jgi:hypothetical protein